MSKTIPFDTGQPCDECGVKGSFDFYGDFLCQECTRQYVDKKDEYEYNEEYCPCEECKCEKE